MSESTIKAYQGQSFTITLRKSGGTNYAWCLTAMPQEVALASLWTNVLGSQAGAPVDEVFTFLALESGTVQVGFKLLELSNPEASAEEVLFDVNITPHNEEDDLNGFIRYSENSAAYVVPPYGFNTASNSVEKYGFPGCDDGAQARQDYGFYGCSTSPFIPIMYGINGCDNGVQARSYYGYFGCPTPPPVKYGYPGCDSGMPPFVAYGYYGCPTPPPIFKYGFPGCQ